MAVDYFKKASESIDQYNTRISQERGLSTPAPVNTRNQQLEGIKQQALKIQSQIPATTGPTSVPAPIIGSNSKLTIPAVNYNTSAVDYVNSIKPLLTSNTQVTEAQKEREKLQKRLGGAYDTLATRGERSQELYDKYGIDQDTKKLQELNLQIAQRSGEFDKLSAGLEGQGRGIELGIITGQQGAVQRQKAAEVGAMASVAQAMQGNIALSQQLADQAIEMEFMDVETEINRTLQFLDFNRETMGEAEKAKAQELELYLADYQMQVDEAKQQRKDILNYAAAAAENGASNSVVQQIIRATTQEDALMLAAPYAYTPPKSGSGSSGGSYSISAADVPSWEEYFRAAEDELRMNIMPGTPLAQELKAQYDAEYSQYQGGAELEGFTPTERKKLEQAGLLNSGRKAQLDYLYGKSGGGGSVGGDINFDDL